MLHIIAGGSGTGKSTLLMQKIRQLLPQEPDCIILVPEQFSYEFDKKLYHFLGATAFNQLETHSFTSKIWETCSTICRCDRSESPVLAGSTDGSAKSSAVFF